MSRFLQSPDDDRGMVMIEFALIAPLIIALLIGVAGFGKAYSVKNAITGIARDAARAHMLGKAYTAPAVSGFTLVGGNVYSGACPPLTDPNYYNVNITATVTGSYSLGIPFFLVTHAP